MNILLRDCRITLRLSASQLKSRAGFFEIYHRNTFKCYRNKKGNTLTAGSVINIQRVGGVLKYANGRKVLFRLSANGNPAVAGRYAFFLKAVEEDYSILTGYELSKDGIVPLDYSPQFQTLQGENEPSFLQKLRDTTSKAIGVQAN